MTHSNSLALATFPEWSLRRQLLVWRHMHKGESVIGQVFIAPDGQQFEVTDRLFWRQAGRKRRSVSLVWRSACRLCSAPYTFNAPYNAGRLVRTCEAHRGKSAAARRTPLRDLVLAELEAIRLLGSASHESVIASCIARLPRGHGRDRRRFRVIRCLQSLIDDNSLPDWLDVTSDTFVCN